MSLANLFSFFDRGFVAMVIDPIKHSLDLTDVQIGFLVGPAFMIFYVTFSVPIARLSDSFNRKHIVIIAVTLWSACTFLFGATHSWAVLVVARMLIGLGEAALFPAAVSMIGDSVEPTRLSRSISAVTAGGILGASLSTMAGGLLLYWLTPLGPFSVPVVGIVEPWQAGFLLIAAPGFLVALLIFLFVQEPVRQRAGDSDVLKPAISETFRYIWRYRGAALLLIVSLAMMSVQSGTSAWLITYYIRHFGLTPAQVGGFLGFIFLVVGVPATMAGGYIADRLRAAGRRDANVIVAMVSVGIIVPLDLLVPNVSSAWLSLCINVPITGLVFLAAGVSHSGVALVVPPRLRSQSVAVYSITTSLVGVGLTPVLVPAFASTFAEPNMGLRVVLTIVPTSAMLAAFIGLMLCRAAVRDRIADLTNPVADPPKEPENIGQMVPQV